jgi:hypothetical protein
MPSLSIVNFIIFFKIIILIKIYYI